MGHISRNFKWFEWSIYLAEREARQRRELLQPVRKETATLADLAKRVYHHDHTVRLEAVRSIGNHEDPQCCEVLVSLLHDEDPAVRQLAMHGLIDHKRAAVRPIMEALTRDFQSSLLRSGAHHVLLTLHEHGHLTHSEAEVIHALEGPAPALRCAAAANDALIAGV